jgi:hypothetical protein
MKAIIKNIDTGSFVSFDQYCPESEACFGTWLTVHIGPDDQEGAHLFQILVCTPDWIKQEYGQESVVWGRHMLIVSTYDRERIRQAIQQYVEQCKGANFWEMAQKFARVSAWEFEDYEV